MADGIVSGRHRGFVPLAVSIIMSVLLGGCTSPVGGEPGGGKSPFPRVGEEAWYHLDDELEGRRQFTLGYRWGSTETARDGLGLPVAAIRVDWTLGEGDQRSPYDPRNALALEVATGRLVSQGAWEGAPTPRSQQFAASSARWYGYPGLLRNATTGEDTIRAMLFPLFGIATRLVANPQATSFTEWGVDVSVERGPPVVVRHQDGASSGDALRHVFVYDREGFFPARVETFLAESGGERRIAALERHAWEPGKGDLLHWGPVGSVLEVPRIRADVAFTTWHRLPPEGTPSIALKLGDAETVARRDVGYAAFVQAHPESYLVRASYEMVSQAIADSPVPTRVVSWTLRFADVSGSAYEVTVQRTLTQEGQPVADSVTNSVSKTLLHVPAPSSLPARLMPLADALGLGSKEVRLTPSDNLFIIYEVSLEPRVAGSEYAVSWVVGIRAHLQVFPQSQATLSTQTGATLLRGET